MPDIISNPAAQQGIRRIAVTGFKSILKRQEIEVKPLTILAGANSSGKSSIMQPLLLLKQTLEAPYDPGALKLDGPNVRFTDTEQLLARTLKGGAVKNFKVELDISGWSGEAGELALTFHKTGKLPIDVEEMTATTPKGRLTLRTNMTDRQTLGLLRESGFAVSSKSTANGVRAVKTAHVTRDRCFLNVDITEGIGRRKVRVPKWFNHQPEIYSVMDVIHVRGLRGNPERSYPIAAFGRQFPGEFERYVAGVLAAWKSGGKKKELKAVGLDLLKLGLTWKVEARRISETDVELHVGRMPEPEQGGAHDLVSIADVGFGVSQTLPVVVALHVARPGQLVYVEQPEIHLHPRAQVAMAGVLARAAQRGVRVVCETHSAHLLLALQTLVAEGNLSPALVALHWFTRKDGVTEVKTADLDATGAYGDWPEDFSDVILQQERRYLDAAALRGAEGIGN
jgi:predicted ATPase